MSSDDSVSVELDGAKEIPLRLRSALSGPTIGSPLLDVTTGSEPHNGQHAAGQCPQDLLP